MLNRALNNILYNKSLFIILNKRTYSITRKNGLRNVQNVHVWKTSGTKNIMKYITLSTSDKKRMPIVGLGTWRATPEEVENAVSIALDNGYTHIDTAFNYNNESAIGIALQKWFESGKGKRSELFITTKLPHVGNRPKDVERFLKLSLEKLQLSYIDLYLIHMPFSFVCDEKTLTPAVKEDGTIVLDSNNEPLATWQKLEEQVKKGLVKAIGLSNFNADQICKIYNNAEIKPSVLQVELHAYLQQKELRKLCKQLNIAITAYSPLGSPGAQNHFSSKYNYKLQDFPNILGHPCVKEIADKYHKTPGQILLKHLVQQDVIVIPKSGNADRIKKNIELFDFELAQEDLVALDKLDKGEAGRIFDFLFFKGVQNHPEYPFKQRLQIK